MEEEMVMERDPKKMDIKRTMADQVWRRRKSQRDFLGDRVVVGTYLQKKAPEEGFWSKIMNVKF